MKETKLQEENNQTLILISMVSVLALILLLINATFFIRGIYSLIGNVYVFFDIKKLSHHLDTSNQTDFEKVNYLRQWIAQRTPTSSQTLEMGSNNWGKNIEAILQVYNGKQGGVNCAGASYGLIKLYKKFGYTAFSYHSGELSKFNHVFTIVKINHKGKSIFSIQDAFFNYTITDKNNNPIDFFDLLTLLKKGNSRDFIITRGGNNVHNYFCYREDACRSIDKVGDKVNLNKDIYMFPEQIKLYELENNLDSFLYPREIQGQYDKRTDEETKIFYKIKKTLSL